MPIFRGTGSASATADETTIDTVTEALVDAEAAQTAAEAARDAAEGFKDDAEALYGDLAAVESAKDTAVASAATATTKASEASTSASNAASSASDANDSYVLTRGAFLDFQTLYLGVKTSDPTEDNEGNPLEEGALYFNSTDDVMRTYDGSQWFTAFASLGGALVGSNNLSDVSSASASLVNLGLNATAAEINVLDVSAESPTDGQVLTYDTSNGLNWETPSTEQNDLTASVTWANVPDANITESSVTQHEAALSITESQISDLQSYITDYTVTEADVTAHEAALSITESQISDLGTYEPADADILKADTADTITAPMRGTVTSVSSSSNVTTYDMNTTNNFSTTTTETTDITFSNETAGQSGNILFVNAGHVVSIDADVHMADGDLNTINVAGTYFLSYFCPDGTNVYLSATPAQTEGS